MAKPYDEGQTRRDPEAEEAEALTYLAEWINIQGDEGEVKDMQDRASREIPDKVEEPGTEQV